jgi:zinc/manganese transport system substrate-binding protein
LFFTHRPRSLPNTTKLLTVFFALLMATTACSSNSTPEASGQPLLVTSTPIWADIVTNVTCGELADVVSIIPGGVDPHASEPSLADRGLMDRAALIIVNGLGLEETLEDTLEASADNGAAIVEVGDQIDALGFNNGLADPHFWFDPAKVAETLPWLAERISTRANLDASVVNQCTTEYQNELLAVDEELTKVFGSIPQDRRNLVTNHDSLSYLANRYGLEVIATVLGSESSLGEATPAGLEQVIEQIKAEGVEAIFTDVQSSDSDAQALADRLDGVKVVELNTGTLGPKGSPTDTYLGLLRTNAELIAVALS